MTFKRFGKRRPLFLFTFLLALVASACGSDSVAFDGIPIGAATIVDEGDVAFVEVSPFAQFGPAQGDFTSGEHGTFGLFGAGQASPPHTHSGAYYAVVLEGGDMNNPFGTESSPPTLSAGSFWSVPADAQHVTACLDPDEECRFFFHAQGAFDFAPLESMEEDRDPQAQSVSVADIDFADLAPYNAAATMWGDADAGPHGTIVRVDAGDETGTMAHRNGFTLVPAAGAIQLDLDGESTAVTVGSIIEVDANTPHSLNCTSGDDCLLYVFSDGALDIRT